MLKNFEQIKEEARGSKKKLVVADAAGKSVIEALKEAAEKEMIEPILCWTGIAVSTRGNCSPTSPPSKRATIPN